VVGGGDGDGEANGALPVLHRRRGERHPVDAVVEHDGLRAELLRRAGDAVGDEVGFGSRIAPRTSGSPMRMSVTPRSFSIPPTAMMVAGDVEYG